MFTLKELAEKTHTEYKGEGDTLVSHASSLTSADSRSICFALSQRFLKNIDSCPAAVLIVKPEFKQTLNRPLIISESPELTFVEVLNLLNPQSVEPFIHPTASIDDSVTLDSTHRIGAQAVIGKNVSLGEHVVIGAGTIIEDNVTIAAHSYLHSKVVICHDCVIGEHCIFHPGVVIGADGFGLTKKGKQWIKIPQIGRVVIKNHVEVGANTTIDRGALDDTIIHNGVKLDNQIQIGHNAVIGENTAIAASAAIAGSAKIGENCQISGTAAIVGHLSIADNVVITAASMVTKSIKQAGVYSSGTPLLENRLWHKNNVRYKSLDELAKTVKKLQQDT